MPQQWAAWDGMKIVPRRGQGPERTVKVRKTRDGIVYQFDGPDGFALDYNFHNLMAEFKPVDAAVPAGVKPAESIAVGQKWWDQDGKQVEVRQLSYAQNIVPRVWFNAPEGTLVDDEELALIEFMAKYSPIPSVP